MKTILDTIVEELEQPASPLICAGKETTSSCFTLQHVKCHKTEDFLGGDECRLTISVDGVHKKTLKRQMKDGQLWPLGRDFPFGEKIVVSLWDEDWPDPDDLIGRLRLDNASTSGTKHLRSGRAHYSILYSVQHSKPLTPLPVKPAVPGIANRCGGYPVRTVLNLASQYASLASRRLSWLSSLPNSQQKEEWDKGPEKTWFGAFRKSRMINLRNRFWKIDKTLGDPLLVIDCIWNKEYFGSASPGIRRIKLGSCWRDAPGSHVDKVQTLVHEAAHIRGATLGGEGIGRYGVGRALTRAKKYPGIAIRTAENIGYYAVCRGGGYKRGFPFRCDLYGLTKCP